MVVRLAPARDSELISRKLGRARSVLIAAPPYLSKHGRPRSLNDLRAHAAIVYLSATGPLPWRLKGRSGEVSFMAAARLMAGSGNVLTHAAVGGLGIAQTFEYHVEKELADGTLEVLLPELEPDPRTVHALFSRQKAALPKVRVFLEFLGELFAKHPASARLRARR